MTSGGVLDFELAQSTYDRILTSGNMAFAGTLNVALLGGFMPTAGSIFNLFDWGTTAGAFTAVNLPTLTGGLNWDISQLYSAGELRITSVSLPGDFNADGTVDSVDYTVWRNHLGEPNEADLNYNGDGGGVTESDYIWWKQRYGNTSPGSGGLATVAAGFVPEPTSWLLALFVGLPAMAYTRRLHRHHFR
jgi:hypothetical protein